MKKNPKFFVAATITNVPRGGPLPMASRSWSFAKRLMRVLQSLFFIAVYPVLCILGMALMYLGYFDRAAIMLIAAVLAVTVETSIKVDRLHDHVMGTRPKKP